MPRTDLVLWGVMAVALLAGAVVRFANVLDYQGFLGDQARDAFVYAGMRHGRWPTLGPASSYGGYDLPPTYYYLVFPFTLPSDQPAFQLLPDVVGSIATTVLLPVYCHRFVLRGLGRRRRLLGATVAAVWASVNLTGISWSSAEWNPYVIPPLLLLDVMVLTRLLDRGRERAPRLWLGAGLVNGVLLGVHSTTLFVVPILFALFCAYHAVSHRHWVGPAAAWTVLCATLVPYAIGEFGRNFANTRMLTDALLHTASPSVPVRLAHVVALQAYGSAESLFSTGTSGLPASGRLLCVLVPLAMWPLWRADRRMVVLWGSITLLLLVVGSSYGGTLFPHYVLLVYFTPILSLSGALLLTGRGSARSVLGVVCAAVIAASVAVNVAKDVAVVASRTSPTAPLDIQESRAALTRIPAGATVCAPHGAAGSLSYLDVETGSARHRFVAACGAGDWAVVPDGGHPAPGASTVFRAVRYTVVRLG